MKTTNELIELIKKYELGYDMYHNNWPYDGETGLEGADYYNHIGFPSDFEIKETGGMPNFGTTLIECVAYFPTENVYLKLKGDVEYEDNNSDYPIYDFHTITEVKPKEVKKIIYVE